MKYQTETMKQLLNLDRNAARALHTVLHLDFEKPFFTFMIPARFTALQVEKGAAAAGYNVKDSVIAIVTKGAPGTWRRNDLLLSTLDFGRTLKIDYKIPWFGRSHGIYNYHGRGDAEEVRKNNDFSVVICQKRADLTPGTEKEIDLSSRFYIRDVRKYRYQNSNVDYIGEIELIRTDDNGSRYTYNKKGPVYYRGVDEYTRLDELIDKSGYIVNRKRANLKRRAATLKSERQKAAYIVTDNTEEIDALRAAVDAKKAVIIAELTAATTSDTLRAAAEKLGNYRGLCGLYDDLERLEKRDAGREYSSIESYKKAVDSIRNGLNAI